MVLEPRHDHDDEPPSPDVTRGDLLVIFQRGAQHPGRNPYDLDSNRASHSGSSALTVRA